MLKTALANIGGELESLSLFPANEPQRSILADTVDGKPDGLDAALRGCLRIGKRAWAWMSDQVRSLLPRREG